MLEQFKAEKTFRFATHGDFDKAHTVLYVLHGYGQLAEYFIRKFALLGDDYYIVAPEGMHRFYLNGTSGRVGASWMTKEARETDISDNVNWLNQLDRQITSEHADKRKIILGFSQGGATAARWHYLGEAKADLLIMWASVFPPDLNPSIEIQNTKYKGFFVVGTEDEYFSEENRQSTMAFFNAHEFRTKTFDGGHDIEINTLIDLLQDE